MEKEIQALILAVEQADSAQKLVKAVQKLSQAQAQEAIPTLITVLGYNNPGAAVAAVDGLVSLGEAAIPAILSKIDGYNYGARAWAIRACALIGDPRGLSVLKEAAQGDFALSVRRAAAKGLGAINWSKLPLDDQLSAQKEVLDVLLSVVEDGEWVVRYASVVALEALMQTQESFQEMITDNLQKMLEKEEDLTVRARVKKALFSQRTQ